VIASFQAMWLCETQKTQVQLSPTAVGRVVSRNSTQHDIVFTAAAWLRYGGYRFNNPRTLCDYGVHVYPAWSS